MLAVLVTAFGHDNNVVFSFSSYILYLLALSYWVFPDPCLPFAGIVGVKLI